MYDCEDHTIMEVYILLIIMHTKLVFSFNNNVISLCVWECMHNKHLKDILMSSVLVKQFINICQQSTIQQLSNQQSSTVVNNCQINCWQQQLSITVVNSTWQLSTVVNNSCQQQSTTVVTTTDVNNCCQQLLSTTVANNCQLLSTIVNNNQQLSTNVNQQLSNMLLV